MSTTDERSFTTPDTPNWWHSGLSAWRSSRRPAATWCRTDRGIGLLGGVRPAPACGVSH